MDLEKQTDLWWLLEMIVDFSELVDTKRSTWINFIVPSTILVIMLNITMTTTENPSKFLLLFKKCSSCGLEWEELSTVEMKQ